MPGSGEGLFARRPLPKGTIAAFYNGIRLPYKLRELGQPKEEWATSGYKIYVNADYESGKSCCRMYLLTWLATPARQEAQHCNVLQEGVGIKHILKQC